MSETVTGVSETVGGQVETVIGQAIDGELLASVELCVDEQRTRKTSGTRLTLELDDGTQVELSVDPDRVRVEPHHDKRATWGELAKEPFAALFESVAPGDHVTVEVAGWWIARGMRIAVAGVRDDGKLVVERIAIARNNDDARALAKLREAAASASRSVADVRVAAPVRGRIPLERLSLVLCTLGALGAIAGVLLWSAERGAPVCALTGIFALIVGLILIIARPPFDGVDSKTAVFDRAITKREFILEPTWRVGLLPLAVLGIFVLIGLVVAALEPTSTGAVIAFGISITVTSGLVALWIWSQRRDWLRLAGLVANGTAITQAASLSVLSRSTRWIRKDETRQVTERTEQGGTHNVERRSRWTEGRPTTTVPATVRARLADGDEVTIVMDGAIWFAPVRYEPTTDVALTTARIDEGDTLLVAGKLREGRFQATGPESLVVFGAHGDARAIAQRLRRGWYVMLLVIVALSVMATVLPFAL